ncbi:homoserine dehydrogenase [Methanobrevibacter sp. TMH8]|uniref:homoserine dehydrogenase n=1 Tax=Methanobrevibacter sp. TMH8 TaxID=2848611 RepID=UPI001CC9D9DB|nr:homoserine dehydrogenase [Methanobrevibacter sp. TMH8]MBZ9570881.1 homoserine dehydrogenase [Methanobrevibacter sp. TMH8]
MKDIKIILMGFGAVGKGVAKSISIKKDKIQNEYGVNLKLVAVADSSSSAISSNGLDEELLIETKENQGKLANYPEFGFNTNGEDVLDSVDYDLLIEATPTNIEDGEPAKSLTLKAFASGKDVVTSNKGHLALFFSQMNEQAKANNVQFKFEASVGGAMPIINFAEETLPSSNISSIIGILNGTTNYILSRMTTEGSSYKNTLEESQQLGIAETDPTQDVEGIDAACKTVILANSLLGIDATYSDVEVEGISKITSEAIELAKKEGYLIKLIAEVSKDALKVSPRLVKKNSPYAVEGTLNMATIKTDLADEVTVVGKGAGSIETASAMLTDVINIIKTKY